MFDSGIIAENLVDEIMSEADIAPDISPQTYYNWIDETEQLLYSEIIKEIVQKTQPPTRPIVLSSMQEANASKPRFEDIYAVYADEKQLIKATAVGGETFPDTYWKQGNDLYYNVTPAPNEIRVFYYIRPVLKADMPTETIKLPVEWVCLIRAKLRGEAYKLVNEDSAAAKWLNDYNVLLEQFKQYMAARNPEFGV